MGKILPIGNDLLGKIMPIAADIILNAIHIFHYVSICYKFLPRLKNIGT